MVVFLESFTEDITHSDEKVHLVELNFVVDAEVVVFLESDDEVHFTEYNLVVDVYLVVF